MRPAPAGAEATAEVVVVGGGPGGAVTAARLALAGRDVVLLEAKRLPRHKVCGDVLLGDLDEPLAAVGTSLAALAPDALALDGCRYVGARGRRVAGRFADASGRVRPWRILPRRDFDARLAAHAVRCGVDLRQSHRLVRLAWDAAAGLNRLTVANGAGALRLATPLVVGADGAASRVARERGLRRVPFAAETGLCVGLRGYVDWPAEDRRATVIGDRDLIPGCGWIVPQADGRANVGVGMIEADRRRRRVRLRQRLGRLLREHAPSAGAPRGLAGWQLPTPATRRRPCADGVLLVGDAAGLVDPFTGHGIQNAARSGVIAAALAERALRRRDCRLAGPLGRYPRALRDAMGAELRLAALLQRFHARPRLVAVALARAAASPRWADRFLALAGHAGPKSDVLRAGFWLDFLRP